MASNVCQIERFEKDLKGNMKENQNEQQETI